MIDRPGYDDLLDDHLVAYDLRIRSADARAEPDEASTELIADTALPDEIRGRLAKARACIDLLRSIRPLRSSDVSDAADSLAAAGANRTRRVARFEVLDTLGSGGFGIVYRAWDPVTHREVALKVPRLEVLASAELRQRFAHEARAAAKLDHANIVPVLEADSDGVLPYIASAYYPGVTLAAWLGDHRPHVTHRAAAELIAALADGLAHAHARGVLHRDVKPSNILLTREGDHAARDRLDGYVAKLMDFGLAKISGAAGDLTRSGAVLGTLHYMPPEQAAGQIRSIGPGSDVYSLGAVLYELLAGQPPFTGRSDVEVLRCIVMDEPSRIGANSRTVPRDLQTIVAKCLEKEPSRRYATADELADDLRRWLRGEPTRARPVPAHERLWKWARRRPALASLMTVAATSVLALLTVSLVYSQRVTALLRVAEQEREAAREQEAAARRSEALAHQREDEALRVAYAADMHLALESWSGGQVARFREILERHVPRAGQPDRRDFAWWCLQNLSQESTILGRHEGGVTAVAASRDGKWLATAGANGVVLLWDAARRSKLAELPGPKTGDVNALAFSPDGTMLVAACDDTLVRRWRTSDGMALEPVTGSEGWMSDVAFSPDGALVAACGEDRMVRLWRADTGLPAGVLTGHTDTVRAVVFTQRGLVSSDESGALRAWDLNTMAADPRLEGGTFPNPTGAYVYDLVVEPPGDWVLGALWGNGYACWTVTDKEFGKFNDRIEDGQNVRSIDCAADALVALGTASGALHFSRAEKRAKGFFRVRHGHEDKVTDVAFLPGSRQLVSGSRDGTARLWPTPECLYLDHALWRPNGTVRWSGDLLTSWSVNSLYVYDVVEHKLRFTVNDEQFVGNGTVAEATNRWQLVVVMKGNTLSALRIADSAVAWKATLPHDRNALAIDAGERWVAVASDTTTFVYDLETGQLLHTFVHPMVAMDVKFVGDTSRLCTIAQDGLARTWDVGTGRQVDEHLVCTGAAAELSLSADGRIAAVRGSDISIWRLADWKQMGKLARQDVWTKIALVGAGDMLMTVEPAGMRLFRVEDGAEVLDLRGHYPTDCVAISPDGHRVAVLKDLCLDFIDGRPDASVGNSP